jgi:hypothetical protein
MVTVQAKCSAGEFCPAIHDNSRGAAQAPHFRRLRVISFAYPRPEGLMSSRSERYLANAEKCQQRADVAYTSGTKRLYEVLASQWRQLAEEADWTDELGSRPLWEKIRHSRLFLRQIDKAEDAIRKFGECGLQGGKIPGAARGREISRNARRPYFPALKIMPREPNFQEWVSKAPPASIPAAMPHICRQPTWSLSAKTEVLFLSSVRQHRSDSPSFPPVLQVCPRLLRR